MNQAEFTSFLTQACSLLASYSVNGLRSTLFSRIGAILVSYYAAGQSVYSELRNFCIWVKNHTGMGAFYRSRHELVFVFKCGRSAHRNNILLRQVRARSHQRMELPEPSHPQRRGQPACVASHREARAADRRRHPRLHRRGDIVLDAFLGSGTTVIAAERVGRRCYGLELDPIYTSTGS